MQINIKVLNSFDALQLELPQRTAASGDVFCTLAWFENLALCGLRSVLTSASAPNPSPYLLLVGDPVHGNQICLPLLNGNRLTALSNYYSSLFGPVTLGPGKDREWDGPATQQVCDAIARHFHQAPSCWPAITLSPLAVESSFYQHMPTALANAGYWVDCYFCFGNWYLDVANRSFAQYYGGRPSNLRHSIERGQRKLSKAGAWRVQIQQSDDAHLEASIAEFVVVYNQSWKEPEPHPQFIPGLIRMAARQGWLRLGVLTLDGRAIAAQLWLVKDKKASIYKLAYVKGFERLSAGSVLTNALMQHAIDGDRVSEVDYLTGDDAYKRDWMSHRRERWGIVAFRPTSLRGLWAGFKHFAGKVLRKITA